MIFIQTAKKRPSLSASFVIGKRGRFNIIYKETGYSKTARDSVKTIFQAQVIRNHCDKFRISGFATAVLNRVTEKRIECI